MSGVTEISGNRVRSFIDRIERLESEIQDLNDGKKEVFSEAKGEGFDVKISQGDHQAQEAGPGGTRRKRDPSGCLHESHGIRGFGENGKSGLTALEPADGIYAVATES